MGVLQIPDVLQHFQSGRRFTKCTLMWLRSTRKFRSSSDDELLRRYQDIGDMHALGSLYERYIELVFGVCLKYLKDAAASEDATMDVFAQLVDKLKTHEVSNFKSWLYVVVKNHCLQVLRRQKAILTEDYEAGLVQSADMMHPEDETLWQHRENGLRECMDGLPAKQKRTVELFYFESKSYAEIAVILDVKKDKVRSFIQNGRRNLKICMEKRNANERAG